jgi:hypothetical protein
VNFDIGKCYFEVDIQSNFLKSIHQSESQRQAVWIKKKKKKRKVEKKKRKVQLCARHNLKLDIIIPSYISRDIFNLWVSNIRQFNILKLFFSHSALGG